MAYDRYDRDNERSRWSGDQDRDRWDRGRGDYGREQGRSGYDRSRGSDEDRGFFERMGDEVRSWFGDEDSDRGGQDRHDRQRYEYQRGEDRGGYSPRSMMGSRDRHEDRGGFFGGGRSSWDRDRGSNSWSGNRDRHSSRDQNWNENRGLFARGGSSERDYNPGWRSALWGDDNRGFDRDRDDREGYRGYRPMTGDYGRSESQWDRDDYRSTSRAGTSDQSDRSRETGYDPHYRSWRDRHMSDLDRDYDDYRREHQSKFESDFGSWRERRQQKRGMLGQIREHMEVVGNDDQHVGTVDKVAGDRIILAKSDPESGGTHHSLSCAEVDRVEGERVILECSATEARVRWRDEDRSRALFEREDQGEMGPRVLDRSFEGTYR